MGHHLGSRPSGTLPRAQGTAVLLAFLGVPKAGCLKGQEFIGEKVPAWISLVVWHAVPLSRTLVKGRDQKGLAIWTGNAGIRVWGKHSAKDSWYAMGWAQGLASPWHVGCSPDVHQRNE